MNELVRTTFAGTASSVRADIELAAARGELVEFVPALLPDGRVAAEVVLRPSARRVSWRTIAVLALVGLAITAASVGVVAWAVVTAVLAAVAWLMAHWLAIVATVLGTFAVPWLFCVGISALGGGGHGHCSGPNTGH